MLPNFPSALSSVSRQLPQSGAKPRMTQEEKVKEIKRKFNLTHGKGKRKKKRKG